ncbi:MAG: hypothetical protein Fur0020_03770 [Thermodesulfovibrionia bacterium]
MVFLYYAFSLSIFKYIIPLFLVLTPYILKKRTDGEVTVRLSLNANDLLTGLIASLIIILPTLIYQVLTDCTFIRFPSIGTMLFHLFIISLPEEVYFRGFLQEGIGNNLKGIIIVSLLFSFIHLPKLFFDNDITSALTFFPSLIMGYLYMRSRNVLPSVIFHFSANMIALASQ